MVADEQIQILIVGGGISGLTLASVLDDAGIEPVVIERDEAAGQRLGAVELWPQALSLLAEAGIDDVRDVGVAVDTWTRRQADGTVIARYESDELGYVSLPHATLREQIGDTVPDGVVQWDRTLESIEIIDDRVTVVFANGVREPFDLVVGADGVRSRTRAFLGGGPPHPCGTRTWTFPLPAWPSRTESTEIWTDHGAVFRAVPVGETAVGSLTVPTNEPAGDPGTGSGGRDRLGAVAEDAAIEWLLPEALDAISADDVWSRRDVRLSAGRWSEGRIALVGDAAHARHRLAGVGPTLAIEDAVVLGSELRSRGDSVHARLDGYADRRQSRLDSLPNPTPDDGPLADVDTPFADRCPDPVAIRNSLIATQFGDASREAGLAILPDW